MRSAPLMVSSQMLAALKDKVLASSSINNNHGQAFDDAWRRHESRVNLIGKIQGLMGYDLRLMHVRWLPVYCYRGTGFVRDHSKSKNRG